MNNKTPVLEIVNLRFAYPNGMDVLKGVNLRIMQGEKVALVGPNGAGKSTLILHTNGILRGHGSIFVMGRDIGKAKGKKIKEIRAMVGMLFQDMDDQLFSLTVWDDVAFGPMHMGLDKHEVERRVERALKEMDIEHLARRMPHELSGGQKRRAGIASILSMDPVLIAADEPSADLDPRGRRSLKRILASLPQAVIVATHDLELVAEILPRCVLMNEGQILMDGSSKKILSDTALLREAGM